MPYVKYTDIMGQLGINHGDTLIINSDLTELAKTAADNGEIFNADQFIDTVTAALGSGGTLLLPTYNWGFCKGVAFDYHKTPCMTGALGKAALKRSDFKRTKHPIYSFAVWGKDKEKLYEMSNKSSFGQDSPFAYMHDVHAKNLFIRVDLKNGFTHVHFIEECAGNLPYRFMKDFTAGYIDEKGAQDIRTYSMFVRNLDLNVVNTINPLEKLFTGAGIMKISTINHIPFRMLDLNSAYEIVLNDILNNRSKSICTYIGQ